MVMQIDIFQRKDRLYTSESDVCSVRFWRIKTVSALEELRYF